MCKVYARDETGADVVDPSYINITVRDINDNDPVFEENLYKAQVKEHSKPGKLKP